MEMCPAYFKISKLIQIKDKSKAAKRICIKKSYKPRQRERHTWLYNFWSNDKKYTSSSREKMIFQSFFFIRFQLIFKK